ncbi:MAG: serine/threonine protein kinase [Deltaproteobacteria bacterium]|nr:serine/threonine protein kinase [Deltaproteobacteria bacterium]
MVGALESGQAPSLGTTLRGGYELRRFLGAGGMAAVYEAVGPQGARVAIKVLLGTAAATLGEQIVTRFKREANILASLDSPNIVPLLEADIDESIGGPFLVMPLLSGLDLDQLIERAGPLHPTAAVRILRQASRAIDAAHRAGVIHRDIKPANLFLAHDSSGGVTVRVLDFGIAKSMIEETDVTQTGAVLGTPHFMSPEQTINAKRVDARSDVWSLGTTLYYALCGVVPFEDITGFAELQLALTGRDAPLLQDLAPWVDPALAVVVHGARLRELEARCPTVSELGEALRPFTHGSDELDAGMLEPVPPEIRQKRARRAELPRVWQRVKPSLPPPPLAKTPPDPLLAQRLGDRYSLLRCLGRGGMGAVYEAQAGDGSRFAIKVIVPELAGRSAGARRRFVREARAVSSIQSEHVVRVVEADTDPAQQLPYIVMELLQGLDLGKLIERQGALQPEAVARLFVQACRGLGAAHALGLVHRDIKPANLFLHQVPSGEVVLKICDFGIAKQLSADPAGDTSTELTRTGGMVGSPMYMSPEQARNAKKIDLRTDIWSLGASLYQALCGSPLWKGHDAVGELVLAICTEPLPHLQDRAPWVAPGLADVVHQALRRAPEHRFQSMEDFAEALARYAGSSPTLMPRALLPVPDQVRASTAPRAKPVELTSISGGTMAHTVAAGRKRPLRTAAAVGAVVLAAAAAAGILAARKGNQSTAAPQLGSASPSATPATAARQIFEVQVQVRPETASARVDGRENKLAGGKLHLRGEAGATFAVALADGDRKTSTTVFITKEGKASPDRIELPEAPSGPPRPGSAAGSPAPGTKAARPQPPSKPPAPSAPPTAAEPPPGTKPAAKPDDGLGAKETW